MADRFEFKAGSLGSVLKSDEIRAAVKARAERMADAARSMTNDEIVVSERGRSRARAYVRRLGSGAAGEAKDRALGRSIGGA